MTESFKAELIYPLKNKSSLETSLYELVLPSANYSMYFLFIYKTK